MNSGPEIVRCNFDSPLGPMLLAASERGLVGAWFVGQRHWPKAAAAWPSQPQRPQLQQAATQLQRYFAGQLTAFELALDLSGGTPFQQAVWRGLLGIAPGQTTSYGALSRSIARPVANGTLGVGLAARAVGAAVGRNPISIIVPCHRVLGASGALTGYAGGLDRKAKLLQLEQTWATRTTRPAAEQPMPEAETTE